MIYLFIVIIFLGGSALVLVNDLSISINAITKRISIPWLRVTLNILLKLIIISCVVFGAICTAIVAIAFNSNTTQKD